MPMWARHGGYLPSRLRAASASSSVLREKLVRLVQGAGHVDEEYQVGRRALRGDIALETDQQQVGIRVVVITDIPPSSR